MRFGDALNHILDTEDGIHRFGWNGGGMLVCVGDSDENHDYLAPTLLICATDKKWYAWAPSQQDLFADDWEIQPHV